LREEKQVCGRKRGRETKIKEEEGMSTGFDDGRVVGEHPAISRSAGVEPGGYIDHVLNRGNGQEEGVRRFVDDWREHLSLLRMSS
jgi:hypothetical protein